jgi:hypothetical protein
MTRRPGAGWAPLALGFRPFFLAVGVEGVLLTLAWLAMLQGWLATPRWLDPFLWHGHRDRGERRPAPVRTSAGYTGMLLRPRVDGGPG